MKYVYSLLVMVLFLVTSCSTDDGGEVQCREIPVPNKIIFIELVNADGINLIENETYIADDILIFIGDSTTTSVFFNDNPDLDNLIAVSVSGEDGDNIFRIQLSDIEEDILKLNLSVTRSEGPCPTRITTLNSITYNDVLQVPEDFFENCKITIVKD
jgi:hypothetical protein|tara:strand:- start:142557 stop:143027 length:471 start_codon:yes stop_codon:yes gene_type:complete